MADRGGNAFRPSSAALEQKVFNNLPPGWPTEEWHAFYWTVNPKGELVSRQAIVCLPAGYAQVCPDVEIGEPGCIQHVRRWGLTCRMALLAEMEFDVDRLLQYEGWDTSDDQRALYWMMQATHFDLPGDFIIASHEHPFLLFAPDGTLRGSYTWGHTYLGALAYYVSEGSVQGTFNRLWIENRALYRQALDYLLPVVGGKDDAEKDPPHMASGG